MSKILVCMSGGVDSSVVSALLVEKGYDVTGAFMVNFEDKDDIGAECWRGDYQDALRVAAKLGIKLMRLDFQEEYKEKVLDYMFKEYEAGKTPNPDVMCNKFIKFDAWLEKAKKLGFDKIATGHYAKTDGKKLIKAKDENKDQTYFLHQLDQEQLSHTIFPLGGLLKEEVRKLAKKFDLPNAEKQESMGICFIGEVPMKNFLIKKIKKNPGLIVLSSGEKLCTHDGLAFYTIGQRHNLIEKSPVNKQIENQKADKINLKNEPLFVVDKDFKENKLILGYEDDELLYKKEIEIKNLHWVSGQEPKFPLKCEVRLRHRQELQKAKINKNKIIFDKKQKAVTPGQFAVFYLKNECLGGGEIL